MTETIIVAGIVLITAARVGRSLYRFMTGTNNKSGCAGQCSNCLHRDSVKTTKKHNAGE